MLRKHLQSFPAMRVSRGVLCVVALLAISSQRTASAGVINQLGFALDKSASISNADFATIKQGVHDALTALIPTNSMYEITATFFGSDITTVVTPTLIDSVATRDLVADSILNYNRTNTGSTRLDLALIELNSQLKNSANHDPAGDQIVNVSTDGNPTGVTNAEAVAAAAADAGLADALDEISVEAIGNNVDTTYLASQIAGLAPGPAGNGAGIITVGDLPAQGFVLPLDSADEYATAFRQKIQVIVNPEVPEPGAFVVWSAMGMLGIGCGRRRRRAA